jgi:hypothetical protein
MSQDAFLDALNNFAFFDPKTPPPPPPTPPSPHYEDKNMKVIIFRHWVLGGGQNIARFFKMSIDL